MKLLSRRRSIFYSSLLFLLLSNLRLAAAPLADFTSGSYVNGNLHGQNGWSVLVQSPYDGKMTIVAGEGLNVTPTTNGSAGPIAFWGTATSFKPSIPQTNSVNFWFTESIETMIGGANLISLQYELYKNAYGNASPLAVRFSRLSGTSSYQLAIAGNAGGTVTGTTNLIVPGHAIGLNYASGLRTSHPLQLSFTLAEGSNTSSWTVTATLTDLATSNTFSTTASVSGATAYYSTTLYPGIRSIRTTQANGGIGDGVSQFVITQFGLNPLAPGGVGSAGLPAPWQSQDIGAVGASGGAGYSGSTYTATGAGADIGGTADAFRYLYRGIEGDFDIQARMLTQSNTNALAEAGLMVRGDLSESAAQALMAVTPGNGWTFGNRPAAGAGSATVASGGSGSAPLPYWIRLNRTGNLITGYRSQNGSSWTSVGSATVSLDDTALVGMAVSSHVAGTTGTATFDNVSITIPVGLGAGPGGGNAPANATLTFSDEFNTGSLDPAKWVPFYTQPNTINQELQVYLPSALTFPPGGGLEIVATKPASPVQGKSYVSGAMTTYGNFSQTYGYFEVKAQIPKGKGFWPAFWLLSDDQSWPPEIDVMENLGHAPQTIHTTLHWQSGGTHYSDTHSTSATDYSAGYHTYGVSWLPESITYYIDGVAVHSVTGSQVPSKPAYLLLNLAVGGSWPGSPDATTPFPSVYKVAWVRAYQYNNAPTMPKAPLVFGPTSLSAQSVHAGDTITISSSLKVGPTAFASAYLNMRLTGFWGGSSVGYYGKSLGACAADSTKPFSFQYTIPNLSPGTYTIWYEVTAGGVNRNLYLAERITVLGQSALTEAEADTYVHDANPATNYGAAATLAVKDGTGSGWDRISYLRFPVATAGSAAKLKLNVVSIANEGTGPRTVEVRQLSADTWTETGTTWNNRPAATGPLIATIDASNVGQVYEIDVTSYINQEAVGDGKASFVLVQPAAVNRLVSFGSREDAAGKPVLEIIP